MDSKYKQPILEKLVEGKCPKFFSQPRFIQAGLWFYHKYANIRAQSFYLIFFAVDLLKSLANNLYKSGRAEEAAYIYEEALSIFCFVKPSKDSKHKETFEDNDLEYVSYQSINEKEENMLHHIKHLLYLNLSICYIRCKMYQDAIASCTADLAIEPNSVKSLFRRALARYHLPSGGQKDKQIKMAENDLRNALTIDPTDENVMELLSQIQQNANFKPIQQSNPINLKQEVLSKPISSSNQSSHQAKNKSFQQSPSSSSIQSETDNLSSYEQQKNNLEKQKEYLLKSNPSFAEYYQKQIKYAEKQQQEKKSNRQKKEDSNKSDSTSHSDGMKEQIKQFDSPFEPKDQNFQDNDEKDLSQQEDNSKAKKQKKSKKKREQEAILQALEEERQRQIEEQRQLQEISEQKQKQEQLEKEKKLKAEREVIEKQEKTIKQQLIKQELQRQEAIKKQEQLEREKKLQEVRENLLKQEIEKKRKQQEEIEQARAALKQKLLDSNSQTKKKSASQQNKIKESSLNKGQQLEQQIQSLKNDPKQVEQEMKNSQSTQAQSESQTENIKQKLKSNFIQQSGGIKPKTGNINLKTKQAFEEDDLFKKPNAEFKRKPIGRQPEEEEDEDESFNVQYKDPLADLPPYIPPKPSSAKGENQLDLCEGNSILRQREHDKIFQHSYKSNYQDYLDQKSMLDSDVDIPEIPGLIPPSYKTYAQKRREELLNENTTQDKKQLKKYQKILLWVSIVLFFFTLWWALSSDDTIPLLPEPNLQDIEEEPFDEFDLILDN